MLIGATYSHREIEWLKLNPNTSFKQTLDLGFDILRLGVYWDESQPSPNRFDFSAIQKLLDQCDKNHQSVVLSVGMKAPRWPEYYVPGWVNAESIEQAAEAVLPFIEQAVLKLQSHTCITNWQVENEPLNGSGPNKWSIPFDTLSQEVTLVRQLDSRPIHLNLWGDDIITGIEYTQAAELADSVGIDIYYHQPTEDGTYHGPNFTHWQFKRWQWKNRLFRKHKALWITELQAEPWEQDNALKFHNDPPSINAQLLLSNFHQAAKLHPQVILLWGLEYWLWRQKQGNPDLLNAVKQILQQQSA